MMINFAFSMLQLKNISRMTRKVTGIDVKNCFTITYDINHRYKYLLAKYT